MRLAKTGSVSGATTKRRLTEMRSCFPKHRGVHTLKARLDTPRIDTRGTNTIPMWRQARRRVRNSSGGSVRLPRTRFGSTEPYAWTVAISRFERFTRGRVRTPIDLLQKVLQMTGLGEVSKSMGAGALMDPDDPITQNLARVQVH